MYKESINDTSALMYRAVKANPSASYVVDAFWPVNKQNNLRTSGVATPHFRQKIKKGELLPITEFIQLRNEHKTSEVDIEFKRNSDGWQHRHYGSVLAYESNFGISWSAASTLGADKIDNDVLLQRAAAAQVSGDWDVLTFAAEFGQTVAMFKNLLVKVTNILKAKPLGTPWDLWLEARYGWRNLANDMNDIEKAFSEHKKRKFNRTSARSSANWIVTTSGTASITGGQQYLFTETLYSISGRSLVVSVSEPPVFRVNLLKTAWEVTRLSFVIDWFINIGRFIDALQFVLFTRDNTAGVGARIDIDYHGWRTFTADPGWTLLNSTASTRSVACIERRSPAGIPIIPLLSVNLDSFKVLDLVALLIQALRK